MLSKEHSWTVSLEPRKLVSSRIRLHAVGSLNCTVSMSHSLPLLQCPDSHLHTRVTSEAITFVLTPEWLCGPLVIHG